MCQLKSKVQGLECDSDAFSPPVTKFREPGKLPVKNDEEEEVTQDMINQIEQTVIAINKLLTD